MMSFRCEECSEIFPDAVCYCVRCDAWLADSRWRANLGVALLIAGLCAEIARGGFVSNVPELAARHRCKP